MKRLLIPLLLLPSFTWAADMMICSVTCYKMRKDDRTIVDLSNFGPHKFPQEMQVRVPVGKKDAVLKQILMDRCDRDYGGNVITHVTTKPKKVEDPNARVFIRKFESEDKISVKEDCVPEPVVKGNKTQDRHRNPGEYDSAAGTTAPGG